VSVLSKKRVLFMGFVGLGLAAGAAAAYLLRWRLLSAPFDPVYEAWFREPGARSGIVTAYDEPCPGAPFLLPSAGFIGIVYDDAVPPYTYARTHTAIDIFGDGPPGTIPVYAAYDGYLTREEDWVSTVIIRHPEDPLDPSRQIWTYYTHMAHADGADLIAFPPGTHEEPVKQGDLIGYQGNYDGNQPSRIALHLHFSIVRDDGEDGYLNESVLANTIDPSPYFGMNLNAKADPVYPVRCR
jgi:murein DD-endopeptidase MepM/ murein hydrolase activator NlpD